MARLLKEFQQLAEFKIIFYHRTKILLITMRKDITSCNSIGYMEFSYIYFTN